VLIDRWNEGKAREKMDWLSKMFGDKKSDSASDIDSLFSKMRRFLEDEKLQIKVLPASMQAIIRKNAACDETPGATGEFGMSESNPIPVNGPLGQLAYLSNLRTKSGEFLFFHRIGAIVSIDVFEAVSSSGSEWFILFLDMHFPKRSRKAPAGLTISAEPSQLSGFNIFCSDFPNDFPEIKQKNANSGLNFAYISLLKAEASLENGMFRRPQSHQTAIDIVRPRLSSVKSPAILTP